MFFYVICRTYKKRDERRVRKVRQKGEVKERAREVREKEVCV